MAGSRWGQMERRGGRGGLAGPEGGWGDRRRSKERHAEGMKGKESISAANAEVLSRAP